MASFPAQVLIIRHGEKPGDPSDDKEGGPDLSVRGSSRAAALPSLFAATQPTLGCPLSPAKGGFSAAYTSVAIAGEAPRFQKPDFIFATQASKHSNRPVETITPTAAALALDVDDKHADADYAKVASDVLTNAKYVGKVVLICWHHGNIPNLAKALGIASPPPWPGPMFDQIWQVTWPNGAATLATPGQELLYGDATA